MLCTELSGTGEGLETLGCPDSPPWSPHPCQHQHPASPCSPPPAIGVSLGWAPSSHGALGGLGLARMGACVSGKAPGARLCQPECQTCN